MTSKIDDVKVFPGDYSTKFLLLQRTLTKGGGPVFGEDPPYILNADGNNALGVDVRKWHSVTVGHLCQDFELDGYLNCSLVFTPWRYYVPVTPQASAVAGTNVPPRGAWIADAEITVAIDPENLGLTQQQVYPTLNADKMFFQVKSVTVTAGEEEEGGGGDLSGPDWLRQAIFGVTPRREDGMCPSVVGTAGGGGAGGGTTTIDEPLDVNTIQLAGNAIDLGAGNVGAGTQRVTIADDDTNLSGILADTGNIDTNTSTTATNTTNIAIDTGNIATDTGNISTNTGNIDTNTSTTATNTTNILTDTNSIVTNTGNIDTNTSNIAGDTATIAGDTTNILADTNTIVTNTTNIAVDTGNISTNTGTTATNTGNCATSLAVMDDWDAVHDAVAGTDGVRLMGYATETQATAVSADGDDVRLALSQHGEVYLASHDYATQSDRVAEVDPVPEKYEFSTLATVTNAADATYDYYIPMAGYMRLDMQLEIDAVGTDVILTVWGSIQADGTAPASLTYQDVTNLAYSTASFSADAMLVDNTQFFGAFNYVRVRLIVDADDSPPSWTIYIKKTWE